MTSIMHLHDDVGAGFMGASSHMRDAELKLMPQPRGHPVAASAEATLALAWCIQSKGGSVIASHSPQGIKSDPLKVQ